MQDRRKIVQKEGLRESRENKRENYKVISSYKVLLFVFEMVLFLGLS